MADSILSAQYHDEDAAREHLEKIRWPEGPECPHCGIINEAYLMKGKSTRKGLWKCRACRKPFTVMVGTIFSDSKIPLHKWLLAVHLMCSSKKGISAHQLWRNLWGTDEKGVQLGSYKTAWFMCHRIRWAFGQEPLAEKLAGVFEIDEVWIGGNQRMVRDERSSNNPRSRVGFDPNSNKVPVLSILQRDGQVRSFSGGRVTGENIRPILDEMVDKGDSHIMTDSAQKLKFGKYGWKHSKVDHSAKEYARHEDGLTITTNTVEGYFSIVRRGIDGVFHHVGKQYLDQYMREFDFRYNVRKMSDRERFALACKKTGGKRLMMRDPKSKNEV